MNYDIVIPVVKRNFDILKINIPYIKKNLKGRNIILLAAACLENECKELFPMCQFRDEDKLISGMTYSRVRQIIESRDKYAAKRTGWYLQQFLKMGYALSCLDKYYLTWDADTIPLREIAMFNCEGIPYFDMKEEYNAPYFTTSKKILGIGKTVSDSFISEHMMFKTEYMREIIFSIEENVNLSGDKFYEKILNTIQRIDLSESGFSEFETYGNYVNVVHKGSYRTRKISSLRNGEKYLGKIPTTKVLDWASETYQIVTFENKREPDKNIYSQLESLMEQTSLVNVVKNF